MGFLDFWVTMFCALVYIGVVYKWCCHDGPKTEDFVAILVNAYILIRADVDRRNKEYEPEVHTNGVAGGVG